MHLWQLFFGYNMGYENFTFADVPAFLEMAAAEGWISSEWELKFILSNFSPGCFILREDSLPVAFVTSIKYDKSGWIGNLIVSESRRGRGAGTTLMKKALDALLNAGAETVWLTASPAGKPVYERLGFVETDVINRWWGKGAGFCSDRLCAISADEAIMLDGLGWGDKRDILVNAARGRGEMIGTGDGFIIIQDCVKFRQLGPWACAGEKCASVLFEMALSGIGKSCEVVLDAPGKNLAVESLLSSRGFQCVGRTSLMYSGVKPAYNSHHVYALGSMGRIG
jgi:GNAT superfamily N-acetyltransferase